jgi:hypothetical protein
MSSTDAERDDNRVPVTLAESSTTPWEWLPIQVNPTTWGLCIESST